MVNHPKGVGEKEEEEDTAEFALTFAEDGRFDKLVFSAQPPPELSDSFTQCFYNYDYNYTRINSQHLS